MLIMAKSAAVAGALGATFKGNLVQKCYWCERMPKRLVFACRSSFIAAAAALCIAQRMRCTSALGSASSVAADRRRWISTPRLRSLPPFSSAQGCA